MNWFVHVLRRWEVTEVGRVLTMEVARMQGRGQPTRQWKDVVKNNMRVLEKMASPASRENGRNTNPVLVFV